MYVHETKSIKTTLNTLYHRRLYWCYVRALVVGLIQVLSCNRLLLHMQLLEPTVGTITVTLSAPCFTIRIGTNWCDQFTNRSVSHRLKDIYRRGGFLYTVVSFLLHTHSDKCTNNVTHYNEHPSTHIHYSNFRRYE